MKVILQGISRTTKNRMAMLIHYVELQNIFVDRGKFVVDRFISGRPEVKPDSKKIIMEKS